MTLAQKDNNSIPTDDVNRTIIGNVAMQVAPPGGDSHSPDDQITPGREWEKYVTGLRVLSCWAQDIQRCKSVPEMYKRVHESRLAQI